MPDVEWSTDVAQADWVKERLAPGDVLRVTSLVPAGFEAYARILHPFTRTSGGCEGDDGEGDDGEARPDDARGIRDADTESHAGDDGHAHDSGDGPDDGSCPLRRAHARVRWREVATANGLPLQGETQFPEIAILPAEPAPAGVLDGPAEGTLDARDAAGLVAILRRHTATPEDCWFCLWEGYGWGSAARLTAPDDVSVRSDDPPPWAEPGLAPEPVSRFAPVPDSMRTPTVSGPGDPIPAAVRNGPRVEVPGRSHFLYRGPAEAAMAFVDTQDQTATLWWAADRSWCVASDLDLTSTYVGGSAALIDELVADDRVEAVRADPGDDIVMRVPGWLEARIDDAVRQLLDPGPSSGPDTAADPDTAAGSGRGGESRHATSSTRIDTSAGTVTATLCRPGRLRSGELWTDSVTPTNGRSGRGWTRIGHGDEARLAREIRSQLRWAVVDLLG